MRNPNNVILMKELEELRIKLNLCRKEKGSIHEDTIRLSQEWDKLHTEYLKLEVNI